MLQAAPAKALRWIRESPAHWDEEKDRLIKGAPAGIFSSRLPRVGAVSPGEWWRVDAEGRTVGYGWMDVIWGDAEVLLVVDPARQREGIGAWILDRLDEEAAARGVNYLYNVVRPTHPDRAGITRWLSSRGFRPDSDGDVLKRRVRASRKA